MSCCGARRRPLLPALDYLFTHITAIRFGLEEIDHAWKLIDKGEARRYVAALLNLGRTTLYRALG